MPTDQVTWNPRIDAAAGCYEIPGGTKLDGTLDSVNPRTRILAGSSSFSSTPTIAQINASAHLNQILGLINRRIRLWNSAHGTNYPVQAYVAAGGRISSNPFATARANIDLLRSLEGAAPYAWSNNWPSEEPPLLLGRHLAELRQALAVISVSTQAPADAMALSELYAGKKYPYILTLGAGAACCYFKEWNYAGGYVYLGMSFVNYMDQVAGYKGPFAYNAYADMYRIRRCLSGSLTAPANRPCSVLLGGSSAANMICRLALNVSNAANTANYYCAGPILFVVPAAGNVSLEIPIGVAAVNQSVRIHFSCTDEDGETLPPGGGSWGPGEYLSTPVFSLKVYCD
jgi:hypothetical protein